MYFPHQTKPIRVYRHCRCRGWLGRLFSSTLSGTENGHEWVDMGTSVKWATTNVGASTPEGYGSYFAWGETKPAPNNDYSEENCRLYGNSCPFLKKVDSVLYVNWFRFTVSLKQVD